MKSPVFVSILMACSIRFSMALANPLPLIGDLIPADLTDPKTTETGCKTTACPRKKGLVAAISRNLGVAGTDACDIRVTDTENTALLDELDIFQNDDLVIDVLNPTRYSSPAGMLLKRASLVAALASVILEVEDRKNSIAVLCDYFSMPAPATEPETYAVILDGVGALGFLARRRKTT